MKVTKAVFPVAGLGTRFLPATKSIPKEILNLIDQPLIQYAIDEAREAGISEFIFVTSRGKSSLEDYFDRSPELNEALSSKGKDDILKMLKGIEMESGSIAYVRQSDPIGLGNAIYCARHLIKNEPFAVILPDDIIQNDGIGDNGCMKQMVDAYDGGTMIACMRMNDPEELSKYGVMDTHNGNTVGMVEKPAPGNAPSNLAAVGRYILDPQILSHLGHIKPGSGGEYQLTDAINLQCKISSLDPKVVVRPFVFDGTRFDCGSKIGFLKATVSLALQRIDLGDEFRDFLIEITNSEKEKTL